MEWIYYFSNYRIPFYIYKIDKGESITYTKQSYQNKCIIILYGFAYLMKIFNNKETIGLGIFNKKDIIQIKEDRKTAYYSYTITALKVTFLMIFEWQKIINNHYITVDLLNSIILSYNRTLYKYEIMNSILSHKSCKNRFIQLILFLCQEYSIIEKNSILIPLSISQITIGTIIGCNKNTINNLLQELSNADAITYSHQKYICVRDPFILSYFYNNKKPNKT